ncbi:MAG: carboxymuconolactone decarboxylase family protein [Acidimicrobiales bacterium]
MKRYHLVEYETASPQVKAVYDDYLASTQSLTVPIWIRSLGSNVNLLRAYWERTKGSLLRGSLPIVLKELVIFAVSVENRARYCSAARAHTILQLDPTMTFDQIASLVGPDGDRSGLPETFQVALDFAVAAARDANGVSDADFERLVDAGFTDAQILELQSVIDLAQMFNSYSSSMRLPLDPEFRPVLDPSAS